MRVTDEVRIERDGPVALLIVDRPAARNALAPPTMVALGEAIDALAHTDDLRAVVVCGGGGRFIAGGDLRALGELRTAKQGEVMARTMRRVLLALEALPVPTIAAIDRYAIGGGAEVAVACDLRVACADAYIAFRHGDFGVCTAWGGARRMERLVGRARALRLLWTGEEVRAAEGLHLGIFDRLAPPGTSARAEAVALAHELASRPKGAVRATKRLFVETDQMDAAERATHEIEIFGEVWGGDAHWDLVEAFWSRRRAEASPPKPSGRGRFIVLEGLDGAGTTSQAKRLVAWLRAEGREVLQTAEPSTGPVGTLLRQAMGRRVVGVNGDRLAPEAIAGLFVADRADHLAGEIEPALARGVDVVCDRYVHSSLAYQGVECDPLWIAQLNAPFPAPDVVIYLRVPVDVALTRRNQRDDAKEIYEDEPFQRRVFDGYESAGKLRPDDPVVVIDGAADLDTVERACRAAIAALFA